MKIIPLITGTHETKVTPFGTLLPGHTGSVTMLQHEGQNILVDTGGRGMFHPLKVALKEHGLDPSDVHMVILTHLHLDHAFNVSRFPEARVFAWMHEWREGETLRIQNIDGFQLLERITLIQTPGHAEEHLSVIVEGDDGVTTVISGDAMNEEYLLTGNIKAFAYDQDLYHKSAKRILEIADVIIPGHGRIFHTSDQTSSKK